MKFKILSIVALLGLFSVSSAFAGDYRNQNNRHYKTNKTVKIIERPYSTTRVVSTRHGVKRVTTKNYRQAPAKRVVKKHTARRDNYRSSRGDRVGLLVGGIVLGSILAAH